MEGFFECVTTLMSTLVRSCVEQSVGDLVALLEEYPQGNDYQGDYHISCDLALPVKIHPIKFYMVCFYNSTLNVDLYLNYFNTPGNRCGFILYILYLTYKLCDIIN